MKSNEFKLMKDRAVLRCSKSYNKQKSVKHRKEFSNDSKKKKTASKKGITQITYRYLHIDWKEQLTALQLFFSITVRPHQLKRNKINSLNNNDSS